MGDNVPGVMLVDPQGVTHHVPDRWQKYVSWTACGRGYDDRVRHELYEYRDVDCMACIAARCA